MSKNHYQMTAAATAQLEIDYLRDQLNQARKRLKDVTTARQTLKSNGYFVENLWQLDDVMEKYHCTKEQALDVLNTAMTNDATMSHIWESVDIIANELGLQEK